MNCKNRKIRSKKYKKYMYCSVLKKEISYNDCINCEYKEYKEYKTIKKRSYSLSKAEKERFSIMTNNLDKCIMCPKKRDNLHEVFYGTGKRQLSIKYGCVIPLCYKCHLRIHKDSVLSIIWKVRCQEMFEKVYPNLDFMEIFGKNYK
ncbi:MAG: hypothetical protein IJL74_02805 [Bacilli bacterium]|nr:hypothetical protein [Bacilli bacterium]